MDISILNFSETSNEQSSTQIRLNEALAKILKLSMTFFGLCLVLLVILDIGEKINEKIEDLDEPSHTIRRLDLNSAEEAFDISIVQYGSNKEADWLYREINALTFKGQWQGSGESEYLDKHTDGEMALRIERINPLSDAVYVSFRLLLGSTIDKWIIVKSLNTHRMNLTESGDQRTVSQGLLSFVEYGEVFEKTNQTENCKSHIEITYTPPLNDHKVENLTGIFRSSCPGVVDFHFDLKLENLYEDWFKVLTYSVIFSVFGILQILNSIWLNKAVGTSFTYAKSLSLASLLQNIIWNANGCLCNFFLTVSYEQYKIQFGITAFIYFINFAVFEIRLLTNVFNLKYSSIYTDPIIMRKKLVQFYLVFYVTMFFSLFYVMKIFFLRNYIVITILATWIPQIIYNYLYRNRVSIPVLNIILISLNKFFLPFYIRGFSGNLFKVSQDGNLLVLCSLIMLAEIVLLYLQSLYGPRCFFTVNNIQFYKNKEEIIMLKPDADNHDCNICLYNLFNTETLRHFSDDFILNSGENKKCKKVFENLTEFHEYTYDLKNKPFMMTSCRHVFHTSCLESWFKRKKECPTCRQEINEDTI